MARWMLVMLLLVCVVEAKAQDIKIFNVKDYGAIADGNTDNSGVFLKAWSDACNWYGRAMFRIPRGTYKINPIVFTGPCKGWKIFQLQGVLKAPINSPTSESTWINFRYIDNLILNGGGILDGQGASVWGHSGHPVLMTMGFAFISNSYVHQLSSINSQNVHIAVFSCKNMTLTNITLTAPGDSPNTDGIKLAMSHGININDVHIGTGDDCIAIISGTNNVNISNVYCGPGHGISVGSLGKHDDEVDVRDIHVKNCTFNGTSDGLRIKTWASPLNHTLKATNFVYEDIVIIDVEHPINIDQEYCPSSNCGNKVPSKVQISNVHYKNIRGSCKGDIAVNFKCSKSNPCQNITGIDVNLWSSLGRTGTLTNYCSHVHGAFYGKQLPPSCI
ncbi:unnamed protein product [Lupinus luteus]|uniref:Polygalacturonase n=1 Tax=Lupinus luteus TaxID=3873 RepID=A0AAV1X0A5_LUPLU